MLNSIQGSRPALIGLLTIGLFIGASASDAAANPPRGRGATNQPTQRAQAQRQQARARAPRARTSEGSLARTRASQASHRGRRNRLSREVREAINEVTDMMLEAINDQATPAFGFIPTRAPESFEVEELEGNGFLVQGLDPSGELDVALLLPVSAHVGLQQTQEYARTNQYNVEIERDDGTVESLPKIASTGLVTEHHTTVRLSGGRNVIRFWPDGSAGVGGFRQGREIVLIWAEDIVDVEE